MTGRVSRSTVRVQAIPRGTTPLVDLTMARRAVVNAASSGSSGCITTKSGDVRSAADPI